MMIRRRQRRNIQQC